MAQGTHGGRRFSGATAGHSLYGPAEVVRENGLPDLARVMGALTDPDGLTDSFSALPSCIRDMEITCRGGQVCFHSDRGSDILAVAHLDTVQDVTPVRVSNAMLRSTGIDDRLGVHIITRVLPAVGLATDVLLTIDEERGASSGRIFEPPAGRRYKMMVEFDRRDCEAVLYQYDTPAFRRALGEFGIQVANDGTYSDISSMSHLGCPGINFGTGYRHAHHPDAEADLLLTAVCIARAADFVSRYVGPRTREQILEALRSPEASFGGLGDESFYGRGGHARRPARRKGGGYVPPEIAGGGLQDEFSFGEARSAPQGPPAHPDIADPHRGEFFEPVA